jgi:hypothetical protein
VPTVPEPRPDDPRLRPPRGVRLTFRYEADPKRAAEALVELLRSPRRPLQPKDAPDAP